jgi:hypothetical protein
MEIIEAKTDFNNFKGETLLNYLNELNKEAKTVKIEDMNQSTLDEIILELLDYRDVANGRKKDIAELHSTIHCNKTNLECRDKKIDELMKEIKNLQESSYERITKIEEQDEIIETFIIMAKKLR